VRAQREKAVATRREPITGTGEFPNINEAEVSVLLPMPAAQASPASALPSAPTSAETSFASLARMAGQGATLPQLAGTASGPVPVAIAPLPSLRTAEPFERLRNRADAYLAKTGSRPKVFLANLGPISAFTARATFAKNFFEAGGIEAIMTDGFSDQDELRQAYSDSRAKLSCICSTDEIYERHAAETAETLRSAGSNLIYLAGRPGDHEAAWTHSGITGFIFAGCDTLKVLSQALDEACA
jgi:methylmalonyl-CoA mutase